MKNDRYSRRAMLQALGIGAGFVPLLEAERVSAQTPAGFPKRLVTITWCNGIVAKDFYPPAGPLTAALPPILSPLEPYKSKILAFRSASGAKSPIDLQCMIDIAGFNYGGHWAYPAILTGAVTSTGTSSSAAAAASIDQLIGASITGIPSPILNLGARPYASSTSWSAAGKKVTAETDPFRLFTKLFPTGSAPMGGSTTGGTVGGTTGPSAADLLKLRRQNVLGFVGGELKQYLGRVGTDDKQKIQAHLDAVNALESKLTTAATTGGAGSTSGGGSVGSTPSSGCKAPTMPSTKPNFNQVANYPTHVGLMMSLIGAAVKCDLARCITLDLIDDGGGNSLTFPWINIASPDYHAIAHQGSAGYTQKTLIDTWFFTQVAALCADLANTPEGTGSALDNTCILICNDMSDGAAHYTGQIPYLIIGGCGGFFKTGQVVTFPKQIPNNQLLTTVCHAMGLQVASVGAKYTGDIDASVKA